MKPRLNMMRVRRGGLVVTVAALAAACVTDRFAQPNTAGSFRVEIISEDPLTRPSGSGCESAPEEGSKGCPHAFPELLTPFKVKIRATALDRGSGNTSPQPLVSFEGTAYVDARPGRIVNAGPDGLVMKFKSGVAVVDLELAYSFGETFLWVEDCGTGGKVGTFATGISAPFWFDMPRIDQIQTTVDNSTSPMIPTVTNICAVSGDPRYSMGTDENGVVGYQGYSHGKAVNAPPAAIGSFLEVTGCKRADYDAKEASGGCGRGPIVVTAISNEGFYVTDINAAAVARGFNSIYAYNFNYPDNLEVGDIVTVIRGSPVEHTCTTQFSNPVWQRDGVQRGHGLLPKAVKVSPSTYQNSMKTYGRNRPENLDMEMLESALVCFDNLAPASQVTLCDVNQSGDIERQGCTLLTMSDPMPPVCDAGMGSAPTRPLCDASSVRPYCFPMSQTEFDACKLSGYVPDNPFEYCCERTCYDDPACVEKSSFEVYGQWVADVYGKYELAEGDSASVKIAVISRDANPDFDPIAFGVLQRAKPLEKRKHVRVIGTLKQVTAARPSWVVTPRTPADLYAPKDDSDPTKDQPDLPCP